MPLTEISNKKILAFSGIGNPASFEQMLRAMGAGQVSTCRYPDHHSYAVAELRAIMDKAMASGAVAVVTTEKDAVTIPAEYINDPDKPLPLLVLGIEVKITQGAEDLLRLITGDKPADSAVKVLCGNVRA